ncbi:hypothetical protein J2Z37_000931 [Ammoniphilus resinae]|uniref:Uncharacterized protein n=1 Tax=Ammoniphilus resinae TaxID=861532 RepID=A0ABS4GL35_9BACL|nr:hypothetical protein [Ammoniphilus resinae]
MVLAFFMVITYRINIFNIYIRFIIIDIMYILK